MSHFLAGSYVFCCWIKEFALKNILEKWISLQSSLQIHRDSPVVQITRKTRLESIPPIQTMAVSRYCVHVHVCIPWLKARRKWLISFMYFCCERIGRLQKDHQNGRFLSNIVWVNCSSNATKLALGMAHACNTSIMLMYPIHIFHKSVSVIMRLLLSISCF